MGSPLGCRYFHKGSAGGCSLHIQSKCRVCCLEYHTAEVAVHMLQLIWHVHSGNSMQLDWFLPPPPEPREPGLPLLPKSFVPPTPPPVLDPICPVLPLLPKSLVPPTLPPAGQQATVMVCSKQHKAGGQEQDCLPDCKNSRDRSLAESDQSCCTVLETGTAGYQVGCYAGPRSLLTENVCCTAQHCNAYPWVLNSADKRAHSATARFFMC
jgi:hypothetical protein